MDKEYVLKRSNGKIFTSIGSNTILGINQPSKTATPVNLIGRNKVSWGQAVNENFLWLAENFAGQTAPKGSVTGQLWYNYNTSSGQLLMSLVDSARQPDSSNPETEADWGTIPLITLMNTVPDGDNSILGRMVLTQNADALMVLMKNKEWREIQTTKPIDKQYESLLDINYDPNKKYIAFTTATSKKPISFFNKGGTALVDDKGYMYFNDAEGALKFGANYFYTLKILAREVIEDSKGNVVPVPNTYKTWEVKGSFYIDNNGGFNAGTTKPKDLPDPRKIKSISQVKDVYDQTNNTANWDINVELNTVDPTLPNGDLTTQAGYENYVSASLNSRSHLGFKITGNISNISTGQVVRTQWSVLLQLTGIPPLGT